jgi:hypothetical protein
VLTVAPVATNAAQASRSAGFLAACDRSGVMCPVFQGAQRHSFQSRANCMAVARHRTRATRDRRGIDRISRRLQPHGPSAARGPGMVPDARIPLRCLGDGTGRARARSRAPDTTDRSWVARCTDGDGYLCSSHGAQRRRTPRRHLRGANRRHRAIRAPHAWLMVIAALDWRRGILSCACTTSRRGHGLSTRHWSVTSNAEGFADPLGRFRKILGDFPRVIRTEHEAYQAGQCSLTGPPDRLRRIGDPAGLPWHAWAVTKIRRGVCAYCGKEKNITRDHIPPKALLAEPYPTKPTHGTSVPRLQSGVPAGRRLHQERAGAGSEGASESTSDSGQE